MRDEVDGTRGTTPEAVLSPLVYAHSQPTQRHLGTDRYLSESVLHHTEARRQMSDFSVACSCREHSGARSS